MARLFDGARVSSRRRAIRRQSTRSSPMFPMQPLPAQAEWRAPDTEKQGRRPRAKPAEPSNPFSCDDPDGRMSELTALTLGAGARRAAQEGIFRHRTRRRASSPPIEKARALNAFVLETPDRARDMARAGGCALGERRGRRRSKACRSASRICSAPTGMRTTACSHILDNFIPTYESTVTANLWRDGAVLLGKLNNDEFAMGSSNETSYFGPVVSPWRRRGVGRKARARRLVGRFGRGGRRQSVPRRHRHRYRRFDPPAGGVLRHRRHQADLWPLLALGHRRIRVLARSGRTLRAHRARLRHSAALDGRSRPKDTTCVDRAGAGL